MDNIGPESSRTDIASNIKIIPLATKRKFPAPFKSGTFGHVARMDANRGITESSREYMAERTEQQLHPFADAANRDISSIRDTVLHMNNVMAKNTAERITAVTNVMDSLEAEEDRQGKIGVGTFGTAGLDTFGVLKLYPTKAAAFEWFSTSWNANPRTVVGGFDSLDGTFWFGSGPSVPLNITGDGSGEAYVNQPASIYLGKDFSPLNTESTLYFYIDPSDTTTSYLHYNSRHTTGSCVHRGYVSRMTNNYVSVVCETLETFEIPGQYTALVEGSGLPRGQWVGFKIVTRTKTAGLGGTPDVVVDVHVNNDIGNQSVSSWPKLASYQFSQESLTVPPSWASDSAVTACSASGDGTGAKIIANDPSVFIKSTAGNTEWWYLLTVSNIRFKYLSIREVDPIP